ncbi:MAG: PEP-CTERM sorting domain-containing protein [Deltaproteobacteria bacterium]|nr:PEP-CTERM sorting domain-containing protein [Deltaproteobacteria bacterium]
MQPLVRNLLLVTLLALAPGLARANTLPLSTTLEALLEDDGSIQVADKLFTNFTYFSTGDMPSAVGVNVIPITDVDGNYGLRFQGAFVDLASSPGGSDALITYDVEIVDGYFDDGLNYFIVDAHIMGNPTLLSGFGSISVVDTFLPQFGPEARMTIFDDEIAGTKFVDWVDFDVPVKKLSVQKDILAIALLEDSEPGAATLSFVDQTYSQIPEPTTLILFGLGLGGLASQGRRRSHDKRSFASPNASCEAQPNRAA